MPKKINGPVDPVVGPSRKLGLALRDAYKSGTGMPYSTYLGKDALDVMAGEPGVPAYGGDPKDAVLILLGGPGNGARGFDKPGAIDVTGGNTTTAVEHGGNAMLFLPGQPLVGPFKLSDAAYGRLTALLSPKPGAGEAGGPDVGSASVGSGDILGIGDFDGEFLTDPQNLDLPLQCEDAITKRC